MNTVIRTVTADKTALRHLLDQALQLFGDIEAGLIDPPSQEDTERLEAAIAEAYSLYNGKETTAAGVALDVVKIFSQADADAIVAELQASLDKVMDAASHKLTITKEGATVTATYEKTAYADMEQPIRLMVALYDSQGHLVGLTQDSGSGKLVFTNVAETGGSKQTVTTSIAIPAGAITARAFAWDSLTGMQPLTGSKEISVQ